MFHFFYINVHKTELRRKKAYYSSVLLSTVHRSDHSDACLSKNFALCRREVFRFAQGNSCGLGKKKNEFILCRSRLFVTLASPNLLAHGKAQINLAFHSTFRNFADKKIKNH